MQRLWLIFAQTTTVLVAAFFVIATFKPAWLGKSQPDMVTVAEPIATQPAPATSTYREAARKALPAVVHIYTTQEIKTTRNPLLDDPIFRHFFGERFEGGGTQKSAGLGSGVIVSSNGYILTNFHVVEAASDIEVALNDGRTLKAQVVGSDPEADLAVLKINAEKLPALNFAPMDTLHVGDVVLAIGNPFGVGQTTTMGIVSALGRSHLGINTFENFIQTDAAINPGNSGGALVDATGNLVGINTAIYSRSGGSQGIGFAIPVSSAKNIMEQIIQNGRVIRGWIGVEAQEITRELADSFGLASTQGALISGVVQASPAHKGGIKPGDVLQTINGQAIKDPQVMLDIIAALKPDEQARFRLIRDKAPLEIAIRIGKRPVSKRPGNAD